MGSPSAFAWPTLSGTIESYLAANQEHRGFFQQLSWSELDLRFSPQWKLVESEILFPSGHTVDEVYASYETGPDSLRAGRIRTEFGFSDWSELYYNGFNHIPLVREYQLVDRLTLTRDDIGAEGTVKLGPCQLQAAAIEAGAGKDRLAPARIDYATARLQTNVSNILIGLDYMAKLDQYRQIYGADARYTLPHWLFRGEVFRGAGGQSGWGAYVDATYRLPSRTRTELVGRWEEALGANYWGVTTQLDTVGVRQIVGKYLSFNLNYGWGSGILDDSYGYSMGVAGWTARAMFQVQF